MTTNKFSSLGDDQIGVVNTPQPMSEKVIDGVILKTDCVGILAMISSKTN